MMAVLMLTLLFLVINSANCLFGIDIEPAWETLRVTYSPNVFSHWAFAAMPLTRSAAIDQGFTQVGGPQCASDNFQGYRYLKDGDTAVILLYDVKGYIAGIQTSFSESEMEYEVVKNYFKNIRMFTLEHFNNSNSYTATAYLFDPAKICTSGRTAQEFHDNPGGENLYLKNGTDIIPIPRKQSNMSQTSWTKGKCFRTMGVHYWYNITTDMNCDYFQPYFLMYNYGDLTGFGFATAGMFKSQRYEHPPKSVFSKFLDPVPDCLYTRVEEVGSFTTMHVYMNVKPWNLLC